MKRGRAIPLVQMLQMGCVVITALASQACSPRSDDVDPDQATQVTQAIAGDCGDNLNVCLVRSACSPWDLNAQYDGLGYTVTSSIEITNTEWYGVDQSGWWGAYFPEDICSAWATQRRSELVAQRPGISQQASNGFTVTWDEINEQYEHGNDTGQDWYQQWTYNCRLYINNYPTPLNNPHDWCTCTQYQPAECEPNNVVVGGTAHTCAVIGGSAKCWGANMNGQLGNNSRAESYQPVGALGLESGVYTMTAGGLHTCAITHGIAECWGANVSGQLGNGAPGDDTTILSDSLRPVGVTNLSNSVQAIAGGNAHTCAVVLGAAKCWGSNDFGQIGDNTRNLRRSPTSVNQLSSGVQAITAGGAHSCAIVNGAAKCWGFNGNGQLGKGTAGDSLVPAQVKNLTTGVQAITAGNLHTCAIVNGGVQCWGDNLNHQLGPATNAASSLEPVLVTNLTGVQAIAAGNNHTCARTTGGAIWCWGDNSTGQLGDGSSVANSATPVRVTASGALTIASGHNHSCAIVGGIIQCWGLNGNGQLERLPTVLSQSNVPIPISDFTCSAGPPVSCH
jgi:alpha-tubulin suppressor-like RCC1 family protein